MDISHYYTETGQGYPLILLHGNGENSDYFSNQIKAFSLEYHVFALDTRGHGRTPRGNKPFTIRQFADDLLDFMNFHNIKKANILGFSDGANIAMVFAINYPERINKLILNGANLNVNGLKISVRLPIKIGYRISNIFAKKSKKAKFHSEMLGLMVNDPDIEAETLKNIKSQTLVIAGTNDMIPESHTKLIADSIPDVELMFIEGDHFIANKKPEIFNEKILQFLRK
ncbi:MAG: alpha/beta fold hydrolase [Acutalibacteraceae bacterium]